MVQQTPSRMGASTVVAKAPTLAILSSSDVNSKLLSQEWNVWFFLMQDNEVIKKEYHAVTHSIAYIYTSMNGTHPIEVRLIHYEKKFGHFLQIVPFIIPFLLIRITSLLDINHSPRTIIAHSTIGLAHSILHALTIISHTYYHTIPPSSYPIWHNRNHLLHCTNNYIHHLPAWICFSTKQNTALINHLLNKIQH